MTKSSVMPSIKRSLPVFLVILLSIVLVMILVDGGVIVLNDPGDIALLMASGILMFIMFGHWYHLRWVEEASAKQMEELSLLNFGNIMALDPDHQVIRWSEGNHRLYGFTSSEVEGRRSYEVLNTHFFQPLEQIHRELDEKGRWEGEAIRCCKDGSSRHVQLLWTLGKNKRGQGATILEISTDITERKKIENRLRSSEERFRLAFEKSSIPTAMTDPNDGRMLRCNQAFCLMLGFSEAEILNNTFYMFTHPDDLIENRAGIQRLIDGLQPSFRMEKRYIGRDGRVVWVDMNAVVSRNAEGRALFLVTHVYDITERKTAQEKARLLFDRVVEEKDKLTALINSIGAEIWFADKSKNFTMANPSALKHFNLPSADRVDVVRLAASLEVYRPDGTPRPVEEAPPLRALVGEVVKDEEEIIRIPSSGQLCYRQVSASPVRNCNGVIIGSVSVVHDITALKRAEAVLFEREEQLRVFIEHAPAAIAMFDTQMRYIEVSRRWRQDYGLTGEDLRGRSHYDIFPEIPKKWKEVHRRCLEGASEREDNDRFLRSDGTVQSLRWEVKPWYSSANRIGGIIIFTEDITELRKSEEELKRVNRALHAITGSNQILLSVEDEATYLFEVCRLIIFNSDYAMVWVGYAQDDEAKSVRPVAFAGAGEDYLKSLNITWADSEKGRGPTGTAIRTGLPSFCNDMRNDPRFSPWRDKILDQGFSSSAVFPLLDNGRAFGAINIYSRESGLFSSGEFSLMRSLAQNISQGISYLRRRAERDRVEAELKESQEHFEMLTEAVPEIVWSADLEGNINYFNQRAFDYSGIMRSDSVLTDLRSEIHPDDMIAASLAWRDSIKCETIFECELRLRRADGQYRWHLARGVPVRNSQRELIRWIGAATDIHDHKLAEEVLKRDKETLDGLVQIKTRQLIDARIEVERTRRLSDIGTLAATVAHELRNPLAAIGVAAYNLKRKTQNNSLEKHFQSIDKKIIESEQIINNLLFYTRLKSPSFEVLAIDTVLDECITGVIGNAGKKVAVDCNLAALKGVAIEADAVQLREIINNVLNNALDAVQEPEGRISIEGADEAGSVRLLIRDNGEGISKADLERVFDPFFTTKAKGTGLGLAVCRQLVSMHDGSIDLESELGQGARVVLCLPKVRAKAGDE